MKKKQLKEVCDMILVSACLAGVHCRYDGSAKENETIMKLIREGKAIPVCPEQIGGLMTPRKAIEGPINGKLLAKDGEDFTKPFMKGAMETLALFQKYHCTKAILKEYSPSCGVNQIYDGNFNGALIEGSGATTTLLRENGIEVLSEKDLERMGDAI